MSTETINAAVSEEISLPPIRRDATTMELAAVVASSRAFPDIRTPEAAAVRILAGREMGVGPIASVIGIRVQAGRVSMDATLMAGCIKRSEWYDYKITAHTNDVCALVFFENGQPVGESAFSMEDAKRAGLAGKDTWKGYPRNMLFARALSNGARWYCAGIFGGSIYTHEELGYAVDEEGRPVEVEAGDGNELCAREQRQQIAQLVAAVGDSMPGFLAKIGIKLLDELSQYEAAKEIKKLEKRLLKTQAPTGRQDSRSGKPSQEPAEPAMENREMASERLTPAQQTLADGFDESRKHSTPEQRDWILHCAQKLIPDETECMEMLKEALKKRNCTKISQLNHLQAAGLIESLEKALMDQKAENGEKAEMENLPFDPNPAK
jgi:hypothetical protein